MHLLHTMRQCGRWPSTDIRAEDQNVRSLTSGPCRAHGVVQERRITDTNLSLILPHSSRRASRENEPVDEPGRIGRWGQSIRAATVSAS